MLADREVLLQTPGGELTGGRFPRSTISPAFNRDGEDQLNAISFCGQVCKRSDVYNDEVQWIFSYATMAADSTSAIVHFAVGIEGANIVCIIGSSGHKVELKVILLQFFSLN